MKLEVIKKQQNILRRALFYFLEGWCEASSQDYSDSNVQLGIYRYNKMNNFYFVFKEEIEKFKLFRE